MDAALERYGAASFVSVSMGMTQTHTHPLTHTQASMLEYLEKELLKE